MSAKTGGRVGPTLKLILPEAFLGAEDEARRIRDIQTAMACRYLAEGVLAQQPLSWCWWSGRRRGPKAQGPDRGARFGTLRLPGRENPDPTHRGHHSGAVAAIRVREGALLELPHVMVLIDDPEPGVIEPLFAESLEKLACTTFR
ncbi:MAG: hypothetical protein U1F59_08665 [Candidatus Competibacteraceae bacterium]